MNEQQTEAILKVLQEQFTAVQVKSNYPLYITTTSDTLGKIALLISEAINSTE